MKIIKQGRKIPQALYTGTCSQCGCEVECGVHELQHNIGCPYPGDSNSYVQCPMDGCYTEITVYCKLMKVMDRYGY